MAGFESFCTCFIEPHQPLPSRSPQPSVILKHSHPIFLSLCDTSSRFSLLTANPFFLVSQYNAIQRYRRQALDTVRRRRSSIPTYPYSPTLAFPPLAAEPVALDCGSFDWHITLIIIAFFARDLHCNVLDTARCHGRPASVSFGSTRDVSPGPRCSTELACRLGRRVAASRQPYVAVAFLLLVFSISSMEALALTDTDPVKYFLISAPVDWSPDQYIRRFLLPTGEYVSCVLWYVIIR